MNREGVMQERYNKYKLIYANYVILIKNGNFYNIFNRDAIIMSKLLEYKIIVKKNCLKIGFPLTSLDKVTAILENNNLNYIVVDQDIVDKEKFKNNTYENYIDEIIDYEINLKKINNIYETLIENQFNPNLKNTLDSIERILCKINY